MKLSVLAHYASAWVLRQECYLESVGKNVSEELGVHVMTRSDLKRGLHEFPSGLLVKWVRSDGHSFWDSDLKYEVNASVLECPEYDFEKGKCRKGFHLLTLDCALHFALRQGILPHFQDSVALLFCRIPSIGTRSSTKTSFATSIRCSHVLPVKLVVVRCEPVVELNTKEVERFNSEKDPFSVNWQKFLQWNCESSYMNFRPLPLEDDVKSFPLINEKTAALLMSPWVPPLSKSSTTQTFNTHFASMLLQVEFALRRGNTPEEKGAHPCSATATIHPVPSTTSPELRKTNVNTDDKTNSSFSETPEIENPRHVDSGAQKNVDQHHDNTIEHTATSEALLALETTTLAKDTPTVGSKRKECPTTL